GAASDRNGHLPSSSACACVRQQTERAWAAKEAPWKRLSRDRPDWIFSVAGSGRPGPQTTGKVTQAAPPLAPPSHPPVCQRIRHGESSTGGACILGGLPAWAWLLRDAVQPPVVSARLQAASARLQAASARAAAVAVATGDWRRETGAWSRETGRRRGSPSAKAFRRRFVLFARRRHPCMLAWSRLASLLCGSAGGSRLVLPRLPPQAWETSRW
ncbi:hypothetical protein E4U53_001644, partial [Claviceps sorghi]